MKQSRRTRGGVNRLIVLAIVLVAVMLAVLAYPSWKTFRFRAERVGCREAMASARDGLIIEYLNRTGKSTVEEARDTLKAVMPARDNLCPAGGNVYLIMNDQGIYEPICGLHDENTARRTRLNASYVMALLKEERARILKEDGREPDEVTVTVNSRKVTCVRVTEEETIHRGTATTNGYSGTVAFYGLSGDFTFSSRIASKEEGSTESGEICYFLYADESYCAIWRPRTGWDGDAYAED